MPKLQHNLDPSLHPFENARQVTRALNSVKLDRLFAKPFIGSLEGHIDGVYSMAKHTRQLNVLLSGAANGELRLWSLSDRKSTWTAKNAHEGFIRGVAFVPISYTNIDNQVNFLSCSDDKTVKLWSSTAPKHKSQFVSEESFTSIDHHYTDMGLFATSGSSCVNLWNVERPVPLQTFSWGTEGGDSFYSVKWNITEVDIFAALGSDRSIILYDKRFLSPLRKLTLSMRSNAICWNPMEAFNFTVANEDTNCYTFDMRKMDTACNVLRDHVSAVMDLDYSPTGEELVTGSYDRTIRIFNSRHGHSRDVYHTKRMQKIFCVKFSMDSRFIISSSDECNIRIWRSEASERLGYHHPRELDSLKQSKALITKYQHISEIDRISKHRHVPKPIRSAQRERRIIEASVKRKEERRRRHTSNPEPYNNKRRMPIVTNQQ